MSATVIVGAAVGQSPTVYPCTVDGASISVVVSAQALATIPAAERDAYVRARALLATSDPQGAEAIATPLASGPAPAPSPSPAVVHERNWARRWLGGEIPS